MSLFKTKTFWLGVLGLIGAAGGYATRTMTAEQALAAAWVALQSIFLRSAIAKAGRLP